MKGANLLKTDSKEIPMLHVFSKPHVIAMSLPSNQMPDSVHEFPKSHAIGKVQCTTSEWWKKSIGKAKNRS